MSSTSIPPAAGQAAPGKVRASRPLPVNGIGSVNGSQGLGSDLGADQAMLPESPVRTTSAPPVTPPAGPGKLSGARPPTLPGWHEWAAFGALMPARGLRPWTSWCARSGHNAMLGTALLPLAGAQREALDELLQLQQASQQQLRQLQEQWLQRWAVLWQEHRQMRQPNTFSKWVEEHFNLVAQSLDLIGQQASELANLEENISVNYGYWAQQRLGSSTQDT